MILLKIIIMFISIAFMVRGALKVQTGPGLIGFVGLVFSLIWLFVE